MTLGTEFPPISPCSGHSLRPRASFFSCPRPLWPQRSGVIMATPGSGLLFQLRFHIALCPFAEHHGGAPFGAGERDIEPPACPEVAFPSRSNLLLVAGFPLGPRPRAWPAGTESPAARLKGGFRSTLPARRWPLRRCWPCPTTPFPSVRSRREVGWETWRPAQVCPPYFRCSGAR